MNAFLELVKVDLQASFDKRKFKQDKKAQTFLAYAIIFGILFLGLSTLYNFIYTFVFLEAGAPLYVPVVFFAGFASILTFSTSLFKIKGIFVGKDYDMLTAMPIKKSNILASKLFSLYIVELIYAAFVMIPNAFIVAIAYQNIIGFLLSFGLMFFIPGLPMIVAALFSLFVTLVADRYKFGNVINIIFYLLFFVAIISMSFMISFSSSKGAASDDASQALAVYLNLYNIIKWFNPSLLLVELTYELNPLFILVFIFGSVALVFLTILFISALFDKVHTVINTFKSNTVYVKKELAVKGQFHTLFKAECKKYFGSKYYFINTIASGLAAIVFGVMAAVSMGKYSPLGIPEEFFMNAKPYLYFVALIIIFGVGIQTPACISISMEGQAFWIIKSTPIDYKKYLLSKILLSSLVLGVCSIIASTVMVILVDLDWLSIITVYLLPIWYIILSSVIGLMINLKRYKFDWKNEMEAVKKSTASYIALFVDWGITILLVGVMAGLAVVSPTLSQLAGLGLIFILDIILIVRLTKKADSYIEGIEF